MWISSSNRFQEGDARSAFKGAFSFLEAALSLAQLGRLCDPIPIDDGGGVLGFSLEGPNLVFQFGFEQNEKLRAYDDLRLYMGNLCSSVYTPITLPTRDHISAMDRRYRDSKCDCAFLKLIIGACIRKLLLDQGRVYITLVALGYLSSGQWLYGRFRVPR